MSNTKRIQSNLLQQNCYLRDISLKHDLQSVQSDYYYESLDEVTTPSGVDFRKEQVSYHITPDYVDSFSDSVDYRVDPVGAVANGVKRTNLGDISGVQDVLRMDMDSQRSLFEKLKVKFSQSAQSAQPAQPADSEVK